MMIKTAYQANELVKPKKNIKRLHWLEENTYNNEDVIIENVVLHEEIYAYKKEIENLKNELYKTANELYELKKIQLFKQTN